MAEAKISQLAKLLSAVMEYEDLPVEIHNAIADWSCPGGRVTNSPELFELILEDKKHPEDYADIPKISHPVYPAEGPKLVPDEKETAQSLPAATELTLGQHIAAVLNHPDTPTSIYDALGEAVTSMYSTTEVTDSPELCQALICKFREVEAQKGGAA